MLLYFHSKLQILTAKTSVFLVFLCLFTASNCSMKHGEKFFGDPGFILGADSLFKIFWSDPGISRETSVDKGIDYEWVKFINETKETLDIAVYNLGRDVIIDAIINARERGVKIRMVGDVDEAMTRGYQTILRTDIPFSLGNPSGIQHNKFAVRDKEYLIMGTGNLTDTDLMHNNNNYAIIQSKSLSKAYSDEFEQMFFGRFAKRKGPKTSNRHHVVNNIPIEAFYSPYNGNDAMKKLIQLVDEAKTEIQFMIFAMTHDELTTALIRAANRGVLVRGIQDFTFIRGTAMVGSRLYNSGRYNPQFGPFSKEDGNENTKTPGLRTSGGKLHCKTMIFDRKIVSTGSFNWSNNAINNNDENMLVLNSSMVAAELSQQWDGIWNYGRPITNQITMATGDKAEPGDIVISEILWAGSYTSGASSGSPTRDDVWLELKNTTNRRIDISNWVITWDPQELVHFHIPDRFSWYEPGVHKLHSNGRLFIEPNGYFLIKNVNKSLPVLNPTSFDNDSSDLKISGTKNFRLTSSFLDIRLYDLTMNLIDRAGNGDPPAAGVRDTLNYRTHSMERFFDTNGKALAGTSPSSWYSSNGNGKTGVTAGDSLEGTGRISPSFKECNSSNNRGCTIGTPNSAIRNNFPSLASNPRGGILNSNPLNNNIPIEAYSVDPYNAVIRMRWAMTSTPTVTGASSVSISDSDPGLLLIGLNQTPGTVHTVSVINNGIDITGSNAEGGNISFTGFGLPKAEGFILNVYPSQSSSRDIVEVEITSGGSAKGMALYYYDSTTLATPNMIYRVGDIKVDAGDILRFQLNSSGLASDDARLGETPTISKAAGVNTDKWDFYSDDPGMPSTDTILFLGYSSSDTPLDLMCYSNRDGDIAQTLMDWGFRWIYDNPSMFEMDGIFPVKSYNDFELQDRCSDFRDSGNGKFLTRVARNKNGRDFTYGN